MDGRAAPSEYDGGRKQGVSLVISAHLASDRLTRQRDTQHALTLARLCVTRGGVPATETNRRRWNSQLST